MGNVKNVPVVANTSASGNLGMYTIYAVLVLLVVTAFFYFQTSIREYWNSLTQALSSYYISLTPSAAVASSAVEDAANAASSAITAAEMASNEAIHAHTSANIVNKVLPPGSSGGGGGSSSGGSSEVFNVAANRFTYYDAEPLCKAMGAELATYEQVKDAWSKGADWCNYGWVKGQMAVYPTSESTYAKLQSGPEEARMSCGTTGINGGYFDNPEMRYGVTCYGKKPAQNSHDESAVAQGAPVSPDAVAFNQKVSKFKTEASEIALSPFNGNSWNN